MEKVIGESVKQTNQTFLRRYVDDYCKALDENFKQDTIRSLEHNLKRDPECTYSAEQMVLIMQGKANLDRFRYYEGKKYLKVVREEFDTFQNRNKWRDTTVHAFVDKETGEVYKPASWKAPAKHVRFDLSNDLDRQNLHDPNFVGWAGGYLYCLLYTSPSPRDLSTSRMPSSA